MPRVELMTPATAPLLVRPYFEAGQPDPITASLAQVPELAEVALPFIGAALGPSFVTARVKEIVILRTSADLECTFCISAHTVVAMDVGLAADEIAALRRERAVDEVFSEPSEQALIAWIDALALGRGAVPDPIAAAMQTHFSDAELVELTTCLGATMWLNRYCTALELPTGTETAARLAEAGFSR